VHLERETEVCNKIVLNYCNRYEHKRTKPNISILHCAIQNSYRSDRDHWQRNYFSRYMIISKFAKSFSKLFTNRSIAL
jgi:hypothetical protein